MSEKINWRKMYNPDFLGAYSLDDGKGGYTEIVATIKSFAQQEIVGDGGRKEVKTVMSFREAIKPMIVNATNFKTMEALFKSKYIDDWVGRKIQIGVENVKVGPSTQDALRIRKFPPKSTETPKCADTGADIVATEKMTVAQVVAWTQNKFGRPLCAEQATKLIAAEKAKTAEPEQAETGVQDE